MSPADLERTLHERFGLQEFRPGQREVIETVLEGRDVLCVMPTGGGKSLCYQLPAVLLPGLTLVVSPLIALMKDQVDALIQRGVRATLLNSTLDPSEQLARIHEIEAGQYELVYVAPERFRSPRFIAAMGKARPSLLAVDEAHCISQWGHDFRPDYSRLGHARKQLGSPPCVALTATATDVVRRDIADQLDLQDHAQFVTGFDRPNLTYAVSEARKEADKLAELTRILEHAQGSSVVYTSSRARCESVAEFLRAELHREAVVYHAGLNRDDRTRAQDRFMSGEAEIVVATNAFGMGVDKPDIRAVVHYNLPGTLEAYYQEAGRAGRDGLPARCELLYAPGDRLLQELFIENEYPPQNVVFQIYDYLRGLSDDPIEKTQAEIKTETGIDLGESAVGTALKLLEGAGAIERFLPRENMAIVRITPAAESEGAEPPRSLVDRLGPQAHVQRIVLIGLEGLVNGRWGEPVYFHPDDLAASLGLDRPALNRAIKALSAELPVDYVPPFRGNAVRVFDRRRRPRDLGIDFGALKKRKDREYDKLERMIQYAQTRKCRRAFLLEYFGETRDRDVHCGRCDNCGETPGSGASGESQERTAIDTKAGREVVLKILSGVARAKGRFGKNIVAQMLKGSGAEKMDRWGLKNLSTYGILPEFSQQELTRLLDALAEVGLVEYPEVERFRPVVNLTEAGWEFLKSAPGRVLSLTLPPDLASKVLTGGLARLSMSTRASAEPSPAPLDEEPPAPDADDIAGDPLLEKLRAVRLALAREAKQPAYCIFTNQTLEALVRTRPTTPAALGAVKGFGPSRLERYGTAVLDAIKECPAADVPVPASNRLSEPALVAAKPSPTAKPPEPPASKPAAPAATPAGTASTYVPTEEWTWRLLERGFSPDEAAAIRGLDRSAIVRHATLAARGGKPIHAEQFLDADTLRAWDSWRGQHGDSGPPPERPGTPELWALFIAARRQR